jgi:hypothetical protein
MPVIRETSIPTWLQQKFCQINLGYKIKPDSNMPSLLRHTQFIFTPIRWLVLKTENEGAQTPLFLALSTQVNNEYNKYYRLVRNNIIMCKRNIFSDCKEQQKNVNPLANIPEECEQLYNASFEACGLAEK